MRLASLEKMLRRFKRSKDGATAIEFGLIALPFFTLTFGVAEVAMLGLAQTSLDFAVTNVARTIRTGEAQAAGATGVDIQEDICEGFSSLLAIDCANLFIDVDVYPSFADVENENPVVDDEFQVGNFGYDPSVGSDIVVVRAYYRWQVLTPLFERIFANVSNGDRILVSTMMFRNEPF